MQNFDVIVIEVLLLISFGLFFIPKSIKFYYLLVLAVGIAGISSFWAITSLLNLSEQRHLLHLVFYSGNPELIIDPLTAFFILIINIISIAGIIYAKGYLKDLFFISKTIAADSHQKPTSQLSLHYFAMFWLMAAMIMVVMLRDGWLFLLSWELMSLSSFILVIFDGHNKETLKAGINYLIQMHIGFVALLIAFLLLYNYSENVTFTSFNEFFKNNSNIGMFLLLFFGFGIKAGFIPLHTWLPEAHPAAPSHVSAIMSGVMIKMGIYGILRITTYLQNDILNIGIFVLIISLLTGLWAVIHAVAQKDIKKLPAYSSIENIGIIGMAMGLGLIGIGSNNPTLMLLGFAASLLHVLNHSLFKSILFLCAGNVYHACHTRNMELLGGLHKKMPFTTLFFLIASIAICGLPPLNGFISEFMIYYGLFTNLKDAGFFQTILFIVSIIGLSLIGGLAIMAFTKLFGVVFLGTPRTQHALQAKEQSWIMLLPQMIFILFILGIGIFPLIFVKPLFALVLRIFNTSIVFAEVMPSSMLATLQYIGWIGIFVLVFSGLLFALRWKILHSRKVQYHNTWGCGNTALNEQQQYTGTSFAHDYLQIAQPVLEIKRNTKPFQENNLFPHSRRFSTEHKDLIKKFLFDKPTQFFIDNLKKLAVLQTGQIQHYILYAFLFILIIFVLTYFNVI